MEDSIVEINKMMIELQKMIMFTKNIFTILMMNHIILCFHSI